MSVVLPSSIRVLMPNGDVAEVKLETYVAGAVVREMSANAPLEALKAQAVASRTYAAAARRHPDIGADVCTTRHCQVWQRADPTRAAEVFRAVSETWGMVAIHNGKLIDAFFHEHCDGHTRSAEDVLMPPVPYLQGVDCACGFVAMKGHGVGLCQRGAIVMARRGASFEQILSHYYRGIVVIRTGTVHDEDDLPRAVSRAASPPAETKTPKQRADASAMPKAKVQRRKRHGRSTPDATSATHSGRPVPEQPSPAVDTETGKQPPVEPAVPPVTAPPVVAELPRVETPVAAPTPEPRAVEPVDQPATEPPVAAPLEPAPPAVEPVVAAVEPVAGNSLTIEEPAAAVDTAAPTAQDAAEPIHSAEEPASPAEAPAAPSQAAVEQPTTPEESVPIPDYVAQLNVAASLSADEIIASAPPVVPCVPESELPSLHEEVALPTKRVHVDHLPGPRMIAGCLEAAGIVVSVEDEHGTKTLVFSGSAPHYGEGGFETMVDEDGCYTVSIDGEQIKIEVCGNTIFIHANV